VKALIPVDPLTDFSYIPRGQKILESDGKNMAEQQKKAQGLITMEKKKDQIMGLWFQDCIEFGHGCTLSIRIKDVLYHGRSRFQEISILDTEKMGKLLVIDGVTMLTEFDEFAYHEMISHVPLLVHPKPSRVLVIGGGDGGTVREIIKHPEVETVHLCEIDEGVVTACRRYLPSLASGLDDPRVKIFYEDGAKFVADRPNSYEIIIVDSTDPIGPGQVLFQEPFYADMKKALTGEGIAVTQCESVYLHRPVIEGVYAFARKLYAKLGYYYTLVPTYPSGMIGFFFCSKKRDPVGEIHEKRAAKLQGLKYYSSQMHRAAFSLPRFARDFLPVN
jgi:spermidine synthase